MAYDEHLAQRIRQQLGRSPAFTEKKMFGGVAFLHHSHMFMGVSDSTLMARVGKALYEDSLAREDVRVMDFTGKPMAGYVFIDEPGTATEEGLRFWLRRCLDFVATLPPKEVAAPAAKKAVKRPAASPRAQPPKAPKGRP